MSLSKRPSKEEVMTWNPEMLADYMRQLNLFSCENVVLKRRITGAQFMNMIQHELQVFPILYVPILAKIQRDLNKHEKMKIFHAKPKPENHLTKVHGERVWDSKEFASESDNEYEGFNQEAGEGNYIFPLTEPHTADILHNAGGREDKKFPPVLSHSLKQPEPINATKFPRLPTVPLSMSQRTTKKIPEKPLLPQKVFPGLKGSAAIDTGSLTTRHPPPTVPQQNLSRLNLVPHVPVQLNQAIRSPQQGLDPRWYRGRITRNQAEVSLRHVNKDGAFLVRDSSHSSTQHPYTLMLLYHGKIYNIKIQWQKDVYFLGSGSRNTKSFPRVKEMIIHHMNTPLLLIDATDQCSEEQPQCCLLHPAVLWPSQQQV